MLRLLLFISDLKSDIKQIKIILFIKTGLSKVMPWIEEEETNGHFDIKVRKDETE